MSPAIKLVFWFSIVYITIALSFWGNSLYENSVEIIHLEEKLLDNKYPDKKNPEYLAQKESLKSQVSKKKAQYWGEGLTFYFFILLSGAIVYYLLQQENKRTLFQKNLLYYVTHELKTPIASVKLSLQTLGKRKVSEKQKQRILNLGLEEVLRLNDLTNNILYLSKIESNQIKVDKKALSAMSLLSPIIREYRNAQETHTIEMSGNDFEIMGDEFLLGLVFSNLISNAIKYSPAADKVQIKLSSSGSQNIIDIIDQGEGIRVEDRIKVFKKFYRGENKESSYISGTGLGLYLVDRLSRLFDIDIHYTYEEKRSIFRLTMKSLQNDPK